MNEYKEERNNGEGDKIIKEKGERYLKMKKNGGKWQRKE